MFIRSLMVSGRRRRLWEIRASNLMQSTSSKQREEESVKPNKDQNGGAPEDGGSGGGGGGGFCVHSTLCVTPDAPWWDVYLHACFMGRRGGGWGWEGSRHHCLPGSLLRPFPVLWG